MPAKCPEYRTMKPVLLMLLLPLAAAAAEPQAFVLHYEASYGNLAGSADRSLLPDPSGTGWLLQSRVAVELLGRTISSIEETSHISWRNQLPSPLDYSFVQKGIGSRSRSVVFAADGSHADFRVNDDTGTLTLQQPTFEPLSIPLLLRDRLAAGDTNIQFAVADRGEVRTHQYRVVGEETVVLPAGSFATVHVERVREGGNERSTDLWLAPGHDHVLVKLLQTEPDGDSISLELSEGTLNGEPVVAGVTPPLPADRNAAGEP